jgi:hypothetical protein
MKALYSDLASRTFRLTHGDMVSMEEAAVLAGTTRVTLYAWVHKGRCIGLSKMPRGLRVPKWQFEPIMWPWVQKISDALGSPDGWDILSYLETPREDLGMQTPRSLIEQGHADKLQLKGA